MNKTAKRRSDIRRSGRFIAPGERAQPDPNWAAAAKLPELDQRDSSLWIPFEVRGSVLPATRLMLPSAQVIFQNLEEMANQFRVEIKQHSWLSAYQLAVGMNQVVVDYLHPDSAVIEKYTGEIHHLPQLMRPVLTEVIRVSNQLRVRLNERKQVMVKLMSWQRKAAKLVAELAQVSVGEAALDTFTENRLVADGGTLSAYVPYFPVSLRSAVSSIPYHDSSSNHTTENLSRMVEEFYNLHPEQARMLTLISVCPTGSYLAPLYAAILKAYGYQEVHILALSPDKPLNTYEEGRLREVTNKNGLVLLCDDPPISGSNMVKTAQVLENAGLKPENTLQLMQLLGDFSSFNGLYNAPLLVESVGEPVYVETRDREFVKNSRRENDSQ